MIGASTRPSGRDSVARAAAKRHAPIRNVPRLSRSSQSQGLQSNGDGSADLYFGPKAPAGKEANWLATVPGKGWFMVFRLYSPLEPWYDKSWRLGEPKMVQ